MTKFAVLLFLAGSLIIFTNLGLVSLFDVDEAVFAQASKEMLMSKDWINPTYNGINRYDKPILIYWLMCASYLLFGINEFSARLPSALAGLFLALSLYIFSKRFFLKENSVFVLIPLLFSPYFFVYSRAAVTDMTLTLFITLSLLSFFINRGFYSTAGFHLFVALAFLTKGLIGIVFPYCISLCFVVITKNWQRLKIILNPFGIILFLIVALPWYLAQYNRNGVEFIEQFFLKHHFQRYTDVISGHKGPFYYYLIALIIGLMPWSFLLFNTLKKMWHQRQEIHIFLTIWLVFVIGFFSLSTTKLPNYILPSIPAATLLIASSLEDINKKWFKVLILFSSGAVSVISFILPDFASKYVSFNLSWLYFIGLINVGTIIVFILPDRLVGPVSLRTFSLAIGMMLIFMTVALKGLPIADEYIQGDLKRFSFYAKDRIDKDERILTYKINKPSILFYSDRKILWAGSPKDAEVLLNTHHLKILITKNIYTDEVSRFGFKLIKKGREYAVFER